MEFRRVLFRSVEKLLFDFCRKSGIDVDAALPRADTRKRAKA